MEIVIIGATEFLPGFALAGTRTTVLANRKDVLEKVAQHKDASVIILDESLAASLTAAQRQELETSIRPVIITLSKDSAEKRMRLRRSIMSTLGVDLLK
jgi:vacuolar-type H+-ATPase subunit F/Vma7